MRRPSWLVLSLLCAGVPAVAWGQSGSGRGFLFREPVATLSVFGGFAQPGARSELFEFTTDELTLGRGDFAALSTGLDLALHVSPRFDIVIGIASARSNQRSEFRDWVDNNDQPIEQTTEFLRVPLSLSARYHLQRRGRTIGSFAWIPAQFDPWVGAGIGTMKYRFRQVGDFIDYQTLDVFSDRFTSEGWAPFAQASVGGGWTLSQRWVLTGEARYVRGSAQLSESFEGFDRLDLSGFSTQLGVAIRF